MFSDKWKKELLTFPNLLSIFRIILIPVYVAMYLGAADARQHFMAGSVLAVSCMTDMADGIVARKFHSVTNVGKILDPLADKLTQFVLILSLSVRYPMLYPVLLLFLVKELFQCAALLFFAKKGKALPGALMEGKICTAVLFVSLIFLVMFPRTHPDTVLFLTLADAGFLFCAFFRYLAAYLGKNNCLTDLNQDG